MKTVYVTDKKQLDELYNESAFTLEGFSPAAENLCALENWLKSHGAIIDGEAVAHIIKGGFMNLSYDLTGDNAYPNELTIISVTGIDQIKIALQRFMIGGRWFDDIVENNERREKEQRGEE